MIIDSDLIALVNNMLGDGNGDDFSGDGVIAGAVLSGYFRVDFDDCAYSLGMRWDGAINQFRGAMGSDLIGGQIFNLIHLSGGQHLIESIGERVSGVRIDTLEAILRGVFFQMRFCGCVKGFRPAADP